MRDPRWTVVAFLSCLTAVSLGLTGEISRAALLIPVAALVGQWRQRRGMRPGLALKVGAQVLAVFAFVFLFWRLSRFDLLGGPVALMLPAQAYYLMLPRTHRLLGRLQLMSLFQLIALAATTTKIFFAMSLVAYLALAPVAFTLAALEAGQVPRRPLPIPRGLLKAGLRAAAAALVLGVGIFLLLPRYEAGFGRMLGARDERLSGFAGDSTARSVGGDWPSTSSPAPAGDSLGTASARCGRGATSCCCSVKWRARRSCARTSCSSLRRSAWSSPCPTPCA
jgi:hypothetical protein